MTRDPLDDLLDRSSPATREVDAARLPAMIAEARAQVPRRPRRGRRIAVASGALAILLVGGAGVAVATDGFSWGPWLSDPVGTYSLTLPSGLDCTVRIAQYTASDPAVAGDVNRIVADWWRSADVAAEAETLVPRMIGRMRASENSVYIAETGETVPGGYGTEWYDADGEYSFAFTLAIGELEQDVLQRNGYTTDDLAAAGLEGGYGVKCLAEDGTVTFP